VSIIRQIGVEYGDLMFCFVPFNQFEYLKVCMCVYKCTHIYTHIYTYIYIVYTYIYIYIHLFKEIVLGLLDLGELVFEVPEVGN
jgi:hypothetical protein